VNTNFSWSNPFYLYLPRWARAGGHGQDSIRSTTPMACHSFHAGCYDTACNNSYTAITDDAGHEIRIIARWQCPLRWILWAKFRHHHGAGAGGTMTTTVNFEIINLDTTTTGPMRFQTHPGF